MRVLLVEDEQHLAQALGQVLRQNNYTVDLASDGEYGLDVLRQLREERVATPILLLSAKGETQDKVTGLDLGADDYLPKPFQTEELFARRAVAPIEASYRRQKQFVADASHERTTPVAAMEAFVYEKGLELRSQVGERTTFSVILKK